jgi:L-cysteine/cystine lyase
VHDVRTPTATHWGSYEVTAEGERIVEIAPAGTDPDPSPVGPGMVDALYDPARILHPAVRKGWLEHGARYQLHRRRSVRITFADVGDGGRDRTLEALDRALVPGVKLLALSHLAWSTGAILPLEEIVALAHERGVLVLADGAQSVGAIPVDMHELGADFYAFTGQKWLCGPHGTGGMFVRRDRLDLLQPTFTGYVGIDFPRYRANDVAGYTPAHGAQRYEVAASYVPSMGALEASVEWLAGQGPIFERIAALGARCLAAVAELPNVELLTPAGHAGLVAFRIAGVDSDACVAALHAQGVDIRSIPDNGAMRIACEFFNTEAEIDRAVDLIDDHARRTS